MNAAVEERFISLHLSGILAVGYTDGQIHVLKIDPSDLSQEPTVVSIYSEPDLLRISCLAVVSLPEVCTVKPVLSDHLKQLQYIVLPFQTGGCLLLHESSAESS